MTDEEVRDKYLDKKYNLLRDFCVPVTPEIENKISSLYPNKIAIENYVKGLIRSKYG